MLVEFKCSFTVNNIFITVVVSLFTTQYWFLRLQLRQFISVT